MQQDSIQRIQALNIIERLCSLPLFMGISHSDMEKIIGSVRFHFLKFPKFKTICNIHEVNNSIYFLLNGTIEVTRMDDSNTIEFFEYLQGPAIIGADVLFGISHAHLYNYKAKTDCQFVVLSKKEITSQLLNYEIFRLNLLNHISLVAQRRTRMLHEPLSPDLTQRFIQFIKHNTLYPAGYKKIKCKQSDLGTALLSNVKNICTMFRNLENKQLIKTSRGQIIVPSLQDLL